MWPGQILGPQFFHLFQEGTGVNNLCGLSVQALRPLSPLAMQGLGGGAGPSFWEAGWWEAEEVARAT